MNNEDREMQRKAGRALGIGCSVAIVAFLALGAAIAIAGMWHILMEMIAL